MPVWLPKNMFSAPVAFSSASCVRQEHQLIGQLYLSSMGSLSHVPTYIGYLLASRLKQVPKYAAVCRMHPTIVVIRSPPSNAFFAKMPTVSLTTQDVTPASP